jgi:hypothetical protein
VAFERGNNKEAMMQVIKNKQRSFGSAENERTKHADSRVLKQEAEVF